MKIEVIITMGFECGAAIYFFILSLRKSLSSGMFSYYQT